MQRFFNVADVKNNNALPVIFTFKDVCNVLLDYLDDQSFLNFGIVCKALSAFVKQNPRFEVIKRSAQFKHQYPDFYYQCLCSDLIMKYQRGSLQKVPALDDINLNVLNVDIRAWRAEAIRCFQVLMDRIALVRCHPNHRWQFSKCMVDIKRSLSCVLPGSS